MSKASTASSVGLLAATAASLCCITPLIALLAGASVAASSLSWLEPFRPYLIAVAVLALGYAWVQSLRSKKGATCTADGGCTVGKQSFLASKTFLLLITVATALIVAFPYYVKAFYLKQPAQTVTVVQNVDVQTAIFTIKGMTCVGCEGLVNGELAKVPGVIQSVTSYAKTNSVVRFDKAKTTVPQLQAAIAKTGYKVIDVKIETNENKN